MFVGSYIKKMRRGGWVSFPKAWLAMLGDDRAVFILPDPSGGKSLVIVPAKDIRREQVKSAMFVNIREDGRMRIPFGLVAYLGFKDVVCFSGNIRTVSLSVSCC